LAAIKIGGIMLGWNRGLPVVKCRLNYVTFSGLGRVLKEFVYTDFYCSFVASGGAIGALLFLVNIPEVGGIEP